MNKYFITYTVHYLTEFIKIQLFITLLSLPILIAWGIPISLLSALGNLLFGPFLTIHIFLSSLIFICSLFNTTCMPLLWLLQQFSDLWLFFLYHFPNAGNMGFAQPPLIFSFLIAILTLMVLHRKSYSSHKKIALYSTLLILLSLCYFIHQRLQRNCYSIPCFNGAINLIIIDNVSILIDPGYIGQRLSAPSWIEYTLVPYIIQHTGRTHLDHVICLQPNICGLNAFETLCRTMSIDNLYIPSWHAEKTHPIWNTYTLLKETALQNNTIIHNINQDDTKLPLKLHPNITLYSSPDSPIKKNGLTFISCFIQGIIDNRSFSSYAAIHTKRKYRVKNTS